MYAFFSPANIETGNKKIARRSGQYIVDKRGITFVDRSRWAELFSAAMPATWPR
jgi:hypothetical protein